MMRRRRKDLCVLFIFISLCFRLKNSYVCASSLLIQVTYITGERDSTPRTIWFWVMLLFSSTFIMTTGPTFLNSFLLSIPVRYFFPPSTFASLLSLLLFSFSTFCACLLPAERYPFLFLFSISFFHDLYNS